jgi:hypothetical protein
LEKLKKISYLTDIMDMKNLLVAIFIIVIVLILISIAPGENQTGHFLMPSIISLEVAIILIIFSLFAIASILLSRNKSYYPY